MENLIINAETSQLLSRIHDNIDYLQSNNIAIANPVDTFEWFRSTVELNFNYNNIISGPDFINKTSEFYNSLNDKIYDKIEYCIFWIRKFESEFISISNKVEKIGIFDKYSDVTGLLTNKSLFQNFETMQNDGSINNEITPVLWNNVNNYIHALNNSLSEYTTYYLNDNLSLLLTYPNNKESHQENLAKDYEDLTEYYFLQLNVSINDLQNVFGKFYDLLKYFSSIADDGSFNLFANENKNTADYIILIQSFNYLISYINILMQPVLTNTDGILTNEIIKN